MGLEQSLMFWAFVTPFLAGMAIALVGRAPLLRDAISIIASLVTFILVLTLASEFEDKALVSVTVVEMLPGLALRFTLEPLGVIFALIASGLWIFASLYAIGYMRANKEHDQTRFFALFAVAIGATLGVAFAGNMLTLFVFYEVLTLSTYPLVTHSGTQDAMRAGRTYLGILLTTSIGFLLFAVAWTFASAGTLDFIKGGILPESMPEGAVLALLFLYMFGIGKAALMPFHRWLPAAMVAPTPVSALLHAVAVVKAGVFSVVKVIVYVFGVDRLAALPGTDWLVAIAGATILIASMIALRQNNLKRRLAYSTISQLSYVVIAAAILTPLSVVGAILHIAAHAFAKITLFFGAGAIYTAAHKTEVSALDGIGRQMPWTMGAFAIASLSMIGLPPTAGFVSKWFILEGAFAAHNLGAALVIIASTVLNAAYFLPIVHRAFLRPAPAGAPQHGEAPLTMVVALSATAVLTVLFFFWPNEFLKLAEDVVSPR